MGRVHTAASSGRRLSAGRVAEAVGIEPTTRGFGGPVAALEHAPLLEN
jgi:hypothetical protein